MPDTPVTGTPSEPLRYAALTDDPRGGNPAGVVIGGALPSTSEMQDDLAAMSYRFDALKRIMLEHDWTTVDVVWRESEHRFHDRDPFPVGGVGRTLRREPPPPHWGATCGIPGSTADTTQRSRRRCHGQR